MPSAAATRHVVAGFAATVGMLALMAAGAVWHTSGAGAASAQAAGNDGAATSTTALSPPTTEVPAPTTTTSPPAPSSTTTPTTRPPVTTPTTAKPKPVPTTVRATVPAAPAATATTAAAGPAYKSVLGAGASAEQRCAAALQWVAQHGLALPTGWGFRCPGQAIVAGTARWGMACWNCEGGGSSWIAVDIGRIGASDASLRYVIAHEICHAIDYLTLGGSSEAGADLCAALHGAPRP